MFTVCLETLSTKCFGDSIFMRLMGTDKEPRLAVCRFKIRRDVEIKMRHEDEVIQTSKFFFCKSILFKSKKLLMKYIYC